MDLLKRGGFYEFCQNNSRGTFDVDDNVCHRLFIEAPNLEMAIAIAESKGCYWDGCEKGIDCSCCGDRWATPWDEKEVITFPYVMGSTKTDLVFQTPVDYMQWIANQYGATSPDCRIFYMDGTMDEIFSPAVQQKIKNEN